MAQTDRTWRARPIQAGLIRFVALVAPIALALGSAIGLTRVLPAAMTVPGVITWWLAVTAVSTLVLRLSGRYFKRLLPLAVLMKLTLAFPDRAPSRFRVSLRAGDTRRLEELIKAAEEAGRRDDMAAAAETILALAGALNAHDPRTRGHAERVRAYADMLGQELGLDAEQRNKLMWAAMLHDIGKLRVPAEIINQPGKLTAEQWKIMRRHPEWGMELAAPLVPWLGDFALAISQHHERFDGSGYPHGLAGEEIALPARIAAVADSFDVMTSVRSYKDARPASEAREELARCAGSQFDPEVVRAFLNIGLGRQRWVAGPIAWLAQVPLLQGAMQGATHAAAHAAGAAQTATAAVAVSGMAIVAPAALHHPGSAVPENLPTANAEVAPVAFNDFMVIDEDGAGTAHVVANDVGSFDPGLVEIVSKPSHGRADVGVDGSIRYMPNSDFMGSDSFEYEICNIVGECDSAKLGVLVNGVNDPPVVPGPGPLETAANATVSFDPLAGAIDVDGDELALIDFDPVSAHGGTITLGSLRYTPPPGWSGIDSFGYTVGDGAGSEVTVTVSIRVTAPPPPPTTTTTTTTTTAPPTTTTTAAPPPTTTTTTTTTTTVPPTTTTTIAPPTTTTVPPTTTTTSATIAMGLDKFEGHDHKEGAPSWSAHIRIEASDANDDGVPYPVFTVEWSGAKAGVETIEGNRRGKVEMRTEDLTGEWVTMTIISVTAPGHHYDPALNQDPTTVRIESPWSSGADHAEAEGQSEAEDDG